MYNVHYTYIHTYMHYIHSVFTFYIDSTDIDRKSCFTFEFTHGIAGRN